MIAAWEDLDQAGLISSLLPGWERLRSMPQREPIHQFTVDRHLMQTAVNASTLVRKVSRPDLLLLAAIFHDIGKGLDGDHSTLGADLVVSWLTRMGVEPDDTALISRLIRYHLLLGDTASRRDRTIAGLALDVGQVRLQCRDRLHRGRSRRQGGQPGCLDHLEGRADRPPGGQGAPCAGR